MTYDILLCSNDAFFDRIMFFDSFLFSLVLEYFVSLLFNKYFNYHSIWNLMFHYLRMIKDIDYNRNQSKKIWPTIFFFTKAIYAAVKIQ